MTNTLTLKRRLQDAAINNFIVLPPIMSTFFVLFLLLLEMKHGKESNDKILMLNLKKMYLIKCLYSVLRNCV
jgi:hypothetical protein